MIVIWDGRFIRLSQLINVFYHVVHSPTLQRLIAFFLFLFMINNYASYDERNLGAR